jgi:hypothetical protein
MQKYTGIKATALCAALCISINTQAVVVGLNFKCPNPGLTITTALAALTTLPSVKRNSDSWRANGLPQATKDQSRPMRILHDAKPAAYFAFWCLSFYNSGFSVKAASQGGFLARIFGN